MQTQFAPGALPYSQAVGIVLLPGAFQQLSDFVRAGFGEALRARDPTAELILTAPRLAHVADRDWLRRLHDEVLVPARARSGTLWLGGVSLGGFMALRYAAQYLEGFDGLCLLAPYLGSRIVAAEIAAHADRDRARAGALEDDDDERLIWQYACVLSTAPPRVFLGFGSEDRFADTQRLLAQALPAPATHVIPGGHEWPVWRRLWDMFLDLHIGTGSALP